MIDDKEMESRVRVLLAGMSEEPQPARQIRASTVRRARRRRGRSVIVGLLVTAVLAYGGFALVQALGNHVTRPAGPCPVGLWSTQSRPVTKTPDEGFNAVAALASNDVWAVGQSGYAREAYGPGQYLDQTYVLHWNGQHWRSVPTPNTDRRYRSILGTTARVTGGSLSDVAAIAPDDVWAVGTALGPLTMHWDGHSWTLIPTPPMARARYGEFASVAAASSHDVWAVGSVDGRALIEHWDGANWTGVPNPGQELTSSHLQGVTVRGADDVWAVGSFSAKPNADYTLIEHWDGTAWSIVPSPSVERRGNFLSSVVATSAGEAWAAGYSVEWKGRQTGPAIPLVLHWDGIQWVYSALPSPAGSQDAFPADMAATSGRDVWMVGSYRKGAGFAAEQRGFVAHWDGIRWKLVGAAPINQGIRARYQGFELTGVDALPSGEVWTVGSSFVGRTRHAVIGRRSCS
jgi:hypothetical protein